MNEDGSTAPGILTESLQWMRRGLFGYRRADVFGVVARLAASLDREWRDRLRLQEELDRVRSDLTARLEDERARRIEAQQQGRIEAMRLLADAEEQAARLRHEATVRIGDAAQRLEEILRVREQVLGEVRGLVETYAEVLDRAEQGAAKLPALDSELVERVRGPREAPPARTGMSVVGSSSLFPRLVSLDAGPFSDFAELAAFERSLAELPKVEDVHIRHFGDERAEIELTLTEETPLVHDLDRHLPYRVTTTPIDHNHLSVEVETVAG